jgi:hypothetical protein
MSSDDKLDILKQMIVIIGSVVLKDAAKLAEFHNLCAHYDEVSARAVVSARRRAKIKESEEPLPNVHEAFDTQTRHDFMAWAVALDLAMLKRIVKAEQFDPAGRARNWRKPEKFAELIYNQLESRADRGAGFQRVIANKPTDLNFQSNAG